MTRAKEVLILTSASMRTLYGRTDYTRESQFLREVDKHLLDGDAIYERKSYDNNLGVDTGLFDGFRDPAPAKPYDALRYAKAATKANATLVDDEFDVGDKLKHPKFGEGLLIEQDAKTMSVMFDSVGMKKLAKGFVKLTKI
jgi:DNA helicase-2/ATP-dependent DNA helicase PcrA